MLVLRSCGVGVYETDYSNASVFVVYLKLNSPLTPPPQRFTILIHNSNEQARKSKPINRYKHTHLLKAAAISIMTTRGK